MSPDGCDKKSTNNNNYDSGNLGLHSAHVYADEDDHHDDVIHYLQPLSKEELIALGRELGLKNSRLTKMNDVAGIHYYSCAVLYGTLCPISLEPS
jgi:hypothetical protein